MRIHACRFFNSSVIRLMISSIGQSRRDQISCAKCREFAHETARAKKSKQRENIWKVTGKYHRTARILISRPTRENLPDWLATRAISRTISETTNAFAFRYMFFRSYEQRLVVAQERNTPRKNPFPSFLPSRIDVQRSSKLRKTACTRETRSADASPLSPFFCAGARAFNLS